MKPVLTWFALATTALMLAACSTFRVASKPTLISPSGHSMDPVDRLQVKIQFNQPVNRSTLVLGKTFILTTENHDTVRGSLYWSADSRSVTFRSAMSLKQLFTFDPDGHFYLKIIGTDTGNGAVKDRAGEFLDGDGDDVQGGNYDETLVITG